MLYPRIVNWWLFKIDQLNFMITIKINFSSFNSKNKSYFILKRTKILSQWQSNISQCRINSTSNSNNIKMVQLMKINSLSLKMKSSVEIITKTKRRSNTWTQTNRSFKKRTMIQTCKEIMKNKMRMVNLINKFQ
jgi:hypothetical protein